MEWNELDSGELLLMDGDVEVMRVSSKLELIELLDNTHQEMILEAPVFAVNGWKLIRKGDRYFYDMDDLWGDDARAI